jgi:hypothetical protein
MILILKDISFKRQKKNSLAAAKAMHVKMEGSNRII